MVKISLSFLIALAHFFEQSLRSNEYSKANFDLERHLRTIFYIFQAKLVGQLKKQLIVD